MNLKSVVTFAAYLGMIAAFIAYVASLGVRVAPPANRTNLSMDVPTINNMELDARVLLRGIPVGKVTGLDARPASGTISFYIDDNYKIPVDSDVRLENLSALGETYIEFEPRRSGGPYLQNGQRLAAEAIKRPTSISDLGASVTRVLNEMNPDEMSRVVGEADQGLPDPNAVLPNLANASLLLRNTTADFHGQGRDVLRNFQTLLQNAGWVGPVLADAAPALGQIGRGLHNTANNAAHISLQEAQPTTTFVFGKLLQRLQKLLDDRGPDIRVITEPLMANVKAIAGALGSVDTSQILTNVLASVPEDGSIELHVASTGR
ncbi:MlaD family protein [Mycobacterium sp. E1747]|uniref:MlaD family protein n=1 Tax=Mycobacterium sp. E1747 TaxID=1834128 RepID=UPI0008000E48|nr:MlaD family protein [Mycobacterium sp. E1747]OBH09012.1 mammalian cell entry protein [Mycobacterium sp. E1747]